MTRGIPTFYLYGEPHRLVDDGFVHVEAVDDRSRPSEWTIQPHSHAELSHIFFLSAGGGAMQADGRELTFAAPCLLLVPATTVHGFQWLRDTEGAVMTMAGRYLRELLRHDAELAGLFAAPAALELDTDAGDAVARLASEIRRELGWSAVGHRAAVDASMLSLLVLVMRQLGTVGRAAPSPGAHVATVARLRERIEQRFRLREPVSVHAAALGISQTALRVACARTAGASPGQILDQRALLEARRALRYSNLSVAEIGFSIGFSDPAYFSRFFQRHMGMSPRRYRAERSPPEMRPGEVDLH